MNRRSERGHSTRAPFRVRARSGQGVTLIEASIVLSVVSILAAALAPEIRGYVDRARQARTRMDIQTIADAIQGFSTDLGPIQFLRDGNGAAQLGPPVVTDANRVELLASDGDIPLLASTGSTLWTSNVNGTNIDTFQAHLVENTRASSALLRYRNPTDLLLASTTTDPGFSRPDSRGFNAPYAWRGPYLRGPIGPDPWGNRYAANVLFLDPNAEAATAGVPVAVAFADYPRMDVFVLSAGPDEEIDTAVALDGATPGDDDFIHVVNTNAK